MTKTFKVLISKWIFLLPKLGICFGLLGLVGGCGPRPNQPAVFLDFQDAQGIKGGLSTDTAEFPFLVNVVGPIGHICGAALIAPTWVMTAAHCVFNDALNPDKGLKKIELYMGLQTANGHGGIGLPIARIEVHPAFRWPQNDIALIQLQRPVVNVRPLFLAPQKLNFTVLQKGIVAGWGSFDATGATPRNLQKAEFEIASFDECGQEPVFVSEGWKVSEDMVCIKTFADVTTCPGDSGGPLFQLWRGQYVAIGVSSWGSGCREKRRQENYQGFSDVAHAYPWIRAKLQSELPTLEWNHGPQLRRISGR